MIKYEFYLGQYFLCKKLYCFFNVRNAKQILKAMDTPMNIRI